MNKIEAMVDSRINDMGAAWDALTADEQLVMMDKIVTEIGEALDMTDEEVWDYLE